MASDARDTRISEQLPVRLGNDPADAIGPPIDLALQSTEAALVQLTKVVMENIRSGGEASPHVEAAERDLRSALRQLAQVKRRPNNSRG